VARHFPGESKEAAQQLIAAIAEVMDAQLGALPWLGAATQVQARGKLARIEALVGYPDAWRRYDVRFDRANFAGNALAAMALEGRRQAAKGGRPYDRDEWLMPPFIVNAYYNPNANNTALPAGILQPPFFGKDRSIAANLGGIGMVVGHELTHGFDDQGAQYDADGNQRNWWQPDDLAQFQAKGACLAQQFSTFEARPGKPINGQLTLGENIADLGGIKHAFLAYRQLRAGADKTYVADGFTEDQQFFVAVGQAWCSHVSRRRGGAAAQDRRSARAADVAGQRRPAQPAAVRRGLRLQGGRGDGADRPLRDLVTGWRARGGLTARRSAR
jgi:putative endopeptidase